MDHLRTANGMGLLGSSSMLLMDDDMIAYFEACEEDSNRSSSESLYSAESSHQDDPGSKPTRDHRCGHQGLSTGGIRAPQVTAQRDKSHGSFKGSVHAAPLVLNHVFQVTEGVADSDDNGPFSSPQPSATETLHAHVAAFLSAPALQSVVHSSTASVAPAQAFSRFIPSDEASLRRLMTVQERQDEVLFDALCCLRLGDNRSFEYKVHSTAKEHPENTEEGLWKRRKWGMRRHVQRELRHLELVNFASGVQAILDAATDVAALNAMVEQFRTVSLAGSSDTKLEPVCTHTLGKDISSTSICRDGMEAIGSAGFHCLSRFFLLVERMLEDFFSWVLGLLEFHRSLQARRKAAPVETAFAHALQAAQSASLSRGKPMDPSALGDWADCSPRPTPVGAPKLPHENGACGTAPVGSKDVSSSASLSFSVWRLELSSVIIAVEQNILPLRRLLAVLEQTSCLEHLHEALELPPPASRVNTPLSFSHITREEFAAACAQTAAVLLDFLVVRSSALQDTSQMDLYRCYMMLTAHLAWPFIELSTAAMYGFVVNIDSDMWRQLLPRMFRISFSHIRVNGNAAENPTDVLSLILNCIEYPKSVETKPSGSGAGAAPPSKAAASALFSARSFIVQSFGIFARRKKQIRRSASAHIAGLLDPPATINPVYEFPCIIPLGFITLEADVISGHHRSDEETETSSEDPFIGTRKDSAKASLWSLQLIEESVYHDIGINKRSSLGERKVRSSEELWINASIPAARWLTAALLIPFGITVQQLQKRRLKDLYHMTPVASMRMLNDHLVEGGAAAVRAGAMSPWLRPTEMTQKKRREDIPSLAENGPLAKAYAQRQQRKAGVVASSSWRWLLTGVDPISLKGALRLLMDVALCRDRERLVDGFLRELFNRGQWWRRESSTSNSTYTLMGTASIEVSAAFSEAVRGIPHADLVQLVVLPPVALSKKGQEEKSALIMEESMQSILEMFSAFQLRFSFPEELSLVLLPDKLSAFVDHSLGSLQSSYNTLFWHHRKGKSNTSAGVFTSKNFLDLQRSGLSFADIWSYVFGYLGSLYYAQMSLREQRKYLQITDVQAHELGRVMGKPNPELESKRSLLSRGIGGTYYSLSFVLDTLLGFTLHEVHSVIYDLENVFCHSDGFDSCTHLCHQLDHLLLHLQMICFPALPPLCFTQEEADTFTATGETVRESVTDVLYLALDPTRFPLQVVSMRTKRAVEALVAVISGCATNLPLLHLRLKPLLTLLTFNNYYGDDQTPFRFR